MSNYAKISADAFNEIVPDVGILAYNFDVTNPAVPADADIITATTGGVTVSCVPTYNDNASDIDNAPNGLLDFMEVTGYDCKLTTTALSLTPELIALSIGPADITVASGKIKPRWKVENTDAKDIYYIAPITGGKICVAVLKNALSSSGFSLKTTKKAKGTVSLELTAHPTLSTQDEVPMDFYIVEE